MPDIFLTTNNLCEFTISTDKFKRLICGENPDFISCPIKQILIKCKDKFPKERNLPNFHLKLDPVKSNKTHLLTFLC